MNQNQTAHYIEKTGAKWEHQFVRASDSTKGWNVTNTQASPSRLVETGIPIRLWLDPITRLPSHLEPYRSDARDPGDGYRVPAKQDSCNQPHEVWDDSGQWYEAHMEETDFSDLSMDYRLPAYVPFPDEAEALADYVEPAACSNCTQPFKRPDDAALGIFLDCNQKDFEKSSTPPDEVNELRARITELESQLARFQWRSPSQMPMVEDMDAGGYVVAFSEEKNDAFFLQPINFKTYKAMAWMPAPKPPVESDCQRIIRQRGLTEEEVRIIREAK